MSDKIRIFGGKVSAKLVHDGFLRVWKAISGKHEIVEKKDAVGLLIYNRDRRQLVFVEQDRPAINDSVIEVIAGHIEECPDGFQEWEWAKETMVREAQEEVGAKITACEIELINPYDGFYSSPGFTTEKIWLGYAQISDADIELSERIFGLQEEDERIKRIWIDLDELIWHISHTFRDMKTMLLVEWFMSNKYAHVKPKEVQHV